MREIEIYDRLKSLIPNTNCELKYNNLFELLVAVILSAQCTDRRVNMVTPILFSKYPDVTSMANAKVEDIANIIRPCGTYKIKSRNIIEMSKMLISNFGGQVPNKIEDLVKLPGVGSKTASVMLVEGFKIPAMPVDTHVLRVSNRLKLASSDNPEVVSNVLKKLYPENIWIDIHYLLLLFGRYYCKAKGYSCSNCVLKDICEFEGKRK